VRCYRRKRMLGLYFTLSVVALLAWSVSGQAATWNRLTFLSPDFAGTMILLTDGTVMVQGYSPGNNWMRLTPNSTGSYINGTWSNLASMSIPRLYYGSNMLTSGKVWLLGGEYSGFGLPPNFTNTGEMYDPLTDTWSPIASHPEPQFGDDPTMLLGHGKILAGSISTRNTYLYDIASDTWSGPIPKVYNDRSDEETWVKLPHGGVLTYDLFQSIGTGGAYAERYDFIRNGWVGISPSDGTASGTIPQLSSSALGFELGGIVHLKDGRIFVIGATGHTAFYTFSTNTWAAGPDIVGTLSGNPAIFGADDAPAAVMPNGHVLLSADAGPSGFGSAGTITNGSNIISHIPSTAILQVGWRVRGNGIPINAVITGVDSASQVRINNAATATIPNDPIQWGGTFSPPTQIFDFNPDANTISPVSPPIPDANLPGIPAFVTRMLVLPTGEVLFSDSSRQLWIYTPDGGPDEASRPIIDAITYNGGGVFTLTGRQLNGQSAGSSYGDDVESDENYPIVRLVRAGTVYYGRTSNWSNTGVATGDVTETVEFTLPAGLTAPGNYSVEVIGAGIASFPVFLDITAAEIAGQ
jgi:hypothetical protein